MILSFTLPPKRKTHIYMSWVCIYATILLLAIVQGLINHKWHLIFKDLLYFSVLALWTFFSFLISARFRQPIAFILTIILVAFALYGALSYISYHYSWDKRAYDSFFFSMPLEKIIPSFIKSESIMNGGLHVGNRAWNVANTHSDLELNFAAKRIEHNVPEDLWIAGFNKNTKKGDRGSFFRLQSLHKDSYIQRDLKVSQPLAGRKFRLSSKLRFTTVGDEMHSPAMSMMVWEYKAEGTSIPIVNLSSNWQEYHLEWDIPTTVKADILRMFLVRLHDSTIEIDDLFLEEYIDGQWQQSAFLHIYDDSGESIESFTFTPTSNWQNYSFPIDLTHHKINDLQTLNIRYQLMPGLALKIKNTQIVDTDTHQKLTLQMPDFRQFFRELRQRWFFYHPNAASNFIAVLGFIIILGNLKLIPLQLITCLTLMNLLMTGSRIATLTFITLAIGYIILRSFKHFNKKKAIVTLVGIAGVGIIFTMVLYPYLSEFIYDNRSHIWSASLQIFLDNIVQGVGQEELSIRLREQLSHNAATHAHNIGLQFAATRGIMGLLVISTFFVMLSVFAWQHARMKGISIILLALLLGSVDVSLLSSGAMFLVILGLNMLAFSEKEKY